jgi:hypothetical protein
MSERLGVCVQIVPEDVELIPPSQNVKTFGHDPELKENQKFLDYLFDMNDSELDESGPLEELSSSSSAALFEPPTSSSIERTRVVFVRSDCILMIMKGPSVLTFCYPRQFQQPKRWGEKKMTNFLDTIIISQTVEEEENILKTNLGFTTLSSTLVSSSCDGWSPVTGCAFLNS